MYAHHEESIANLVRHFEDDPEPRAVLLAGSIAHGFENPESDVDLLLIVTDEDYRARAAEKRLNFFDVECCTYEGGYAEGKYLSERFIEEVAEKGSEPARFALHDASVLVAREDYSDCLQRIGRYPAEGKDDRISRYFAQVEAWHWYATEAIRLENDYLLGTAISKLALFGGRLILTDNELFYPYHKWFVRVLESAPDKPDAFMEAFHALHRAPTLESVTRFRDLCVFHKNWSTPEGGWPVQFLFDSELNWLGGDPPVDDL